MSLVKREWMKAMDKEAQEAEEEEAIMHHPSDPRYLIAALKEYARRQRERERLETGGRKQSATKKPAQTSCKAPKTKARKPNKIRRKQKRD